MNLAQALDHAFSESFPGFMSDDESLNAERRKNEEALAVLLNMWNTSLDADDPFDFNLARTLADRNRELCDLYGIERLENVNGTSLARRLSDHDLIRSVAKLQKRTEKRVAKTAGAGVHDLDIAFTEKPVQGVVCGIDIETTSRFPDRGYIINLGIAFMELSSTAVPQEGHSAYFGLPRMYEQKGVPLARIHQISWDDVSEKTAFRDDHKMHEVLLKAFTSFPVMAHNAAFEDSWLMLHMDGYAEARKAGKIVLVDSRDICRRIDVEVRTLPRESSPAALENWARRRGTLAADEKERHLGLDDVFLMLRTVQAEFKLRNMLTK